MVTIEVLHAEILKQSEILKMALKELEDLKLSILNNKPPRKIDNLRIHSIILAAAEHYNTDCSLVKSKSKDAKATLARKVAIFILTEHEKLSFDEIAKIFKREKESIISAHEMIRESAKIYTKLSDSIAKIKMSYIN